jgi:putative transposase
VNISRGSAYYTAKPVRDDDLKRMRRVDELHLELPVAGARMRATCWAEHASLRAASA